MKITTTNLQALTISDAQGLDPVTAILRDIAPGKGQLIVECYGQAWSAYWGAMGEREKPETVREFLLSVSADYAANCLFTGARGTMLRRMEPRQMAYLTRIVTALKQALQTTAGAAA